MVTITAFELLKNVPQEAVRDVRRILAHVKNLPYESLIFSSENVTLDQKEQQKFEGLLERYRQSEPVSKIIGCKSFWKHEFLVSAAVLDPRPETELIIESVLKYYCKVAPKKILDIGTGSGCILLSLLLEFEGACGIGIDISRDALEVAEKNRSKLGIRESRVQLLNVGWNDLLKYQEELRDIDLIVSNPPYIRTSDLEGLNERVRKYDPRIALNGGADGLDAYRGICTVAKEIFGEYQQGECGAIGRMFLEIGYDQAESVMKILKNSGFTRVEKAKDLAGIDRVLIV